MLTRTTLLSVCSTALVLLVSAGLSAAVELTQVRTTHYGWLNNSCEKDMPGDCIATRGQTQHFRANISSDGSFEHPTTLAVAAVMPAGAARVSYHSQWLPSFSRSCVCP